MEQGILQADSIFQAVVTYVLSPVYQLVAMAAFLYFLYGVLVYIVNLKNAEKRDDGRRHMLYGLLGIFILFSLNGILQWMDGILGGIFLY